MTRAQLLAYIDSVFTTNGIGSITGANANGVLDEIVNSILDAVEALPAGYQVDDKSIELDGDGKLSVKVASYPVGVAPNGQFPYAYVLKYTIPGTSFTGGMYVKVDATTIGVNGSGALCTISGGATPDSVVLFDDFTGAVVDGVSSKAYQSITGTNGYLKLDTGATPDDAYIIKTPTFWPDMAPSFAIRFKAAAVVTGEVIYLGFVDDIITPDATSIGFYFKFDPAVDDTYWHVVTGDGVDDVEFTTTVAFDTNEHEFKANYNDEITTFYIDGVEVHAENLALPSEAMRLGVRLNCSSSNHAIGYIDYVMALQPKVAETGLSYSDTELATNYVEKKYICKVSQTGTSAPTATVFKQEFGYPVWQYSNVGVYRLYLSGKFTSGQTTPKYQKWYDSSGNYYELYWVDASNMELVSKTGSGTPTNGLLVAEDIEISVYSLETIS